MNCFEFARASEDVKRYHMYLNAQPIEIERTIPPHIPSRYSIKYYALYDFFVQVSYHLVLKTTEIRAIHADEMIHMMDISELNLEVLNDETNG